MNEQRYSALLAVGLFILMALGCGQSEPPKPPVAQDILTLDGPEKQGSLAPNQTYTYSLDVPSNSRSYVLLEGEYVSRPYLGLKTSKGYEMQITYLPGLGYNNALRLGFQFDSGLENKFFVEVRGGNQSSKYRIKVKGGCGTGSFNTLTLLQQGGRMIEDKLEDALDTKDYIFDGRRQKVTVIVDPDNTLRPMVEILDDKCNVIGPYEKDVGERLEVEYTPQFEGKYLIRVRADASYGGRYRIAVR